MCISNKCLRSVDGAGLGATLRKPLSYSIFTGGFDVITNLLGVRMIFEFLLQPLPNILLFAFLLRPLLPEFLSR